MGYPTKLDDIPYTQLIIHIIILFIFQLLVDDLLVYSGSLPPVATHAQGILPTLRPPMKPYIITLRDPNLNDDVIGGCDQSEGVGFGGDIQFTNNRHVVVAPSKTRQLAANQGMLLALYIGAVSLLVVYSGTSEQGTHWGQYKFTCFVLCREVVLFSEVVNVLKL